jgi:hypothetical protein
METNQTIEASVLQTGGPSVFISHDTRDAGLAAAFSALLRSVSAGVLKSFRSSDRQGNQGIEFGVEWYPAIIKEIQAASDVVCLLTERSVNRPWILFEAGMAKGKLDTPILGIALGIALNKVSAGPFAQFQNCADDEESLTKLVSQLIGRIPGSEPDRDTIKFHVVKFRKEIEPIILSLRESGSSKESSEQQQVSDIANTSARLFEEIKIMFNDLPTQIERSRVYRSVNNRKRITAKMLNKLLDEIQDKANGSALLVRIMLSMFKETMPWVCDEGYILLQNLQSVQSSKHRKLMLNEFEKNLFLSTRIPYLEDCFIDSEDDLYLLRSLPSLLLEQLYRFAVLDQQDESSL